MNASERLNYVSYRHLFPSKLTTEDGKRDCKPSIPSPAVPGAAIHQVMEMTHREKERQEGNS